MKTRTALSSAFSALKKYAKSKSRRRKFADACFGAALCVFSAYYSAKLFRLLSALGCEFVFPCVIFAAYPLCAFAFDAANGLPEFADKALLSLCESSEGAESYESGEGYESGESGEGGSPRESRKSRENAERSECGNIPLAAVGIAPFCLLHLPAAAIFLYIPCLAYLILGGFSAASAVCFVLCGAAAPFVPLAFSYAAAQAAKRLKKRGRALFKAAASLVAACGMCLYDLPFVLPVRGLFDFYGFLEKFAFPARFFGRALSGSFGFLALFLVTALAFAVLLFASSLRNVEKIKARHKETKPPQ